MLLTGEEPFFIVMNTGSGKGDAREKADAIQSVMNEAGRRYELTQVRGGNSLAQAAKQAVRKAQKEKGIVVACGGDGTLNAVAQSAWNSGRPFGILPQGTFNYFGRTYGIPADAAEAARILLTAQCRPVQVGMLNDRIFLVNASLGLYPQLLEDREAYKKRFGRSRFIALCSGLVSLTHQYRQLDLQILHDGGQRSIRTPTLVVGNNPLQLEQVGIPEGAVLQEGQLVAMTLRPVGTLAMYGLLLRGAFSRLGEADQLISFGFSSMMVRLGAPRRAHRIKVAMDGEVTFMQAPLSFQVASVPLQLLVPVQHEDENGEQAARGDDDDTGGGA
jgi:diacylglycerol kinase family enzyme